jgi:hypothetical protein
MSNELSLRTQQTALKQIAKKGKDCINAAWDLASLADVYAAEAKYLEAQIKHAKSLKVKQFDREHFPVPGYRKPHRRKGL